MLMLLILGNTLRTTNLGIFFYILRITATSDSCQSIPGVDLNPYFLVRGL